MSAGVRSLLVLALILVAAPTAQAADIFAVGSQARLTRVGPDGNTAVTARAPAVAFNSRDNEYLVVWIGNTVAGTNHEVLGQVLDGNGAPKGPVQVLSAVPDAEGAPAQAIVGYSPLVNLYVVAYVATPLVLGGTPDNSPSGQREVMAQAVTATGARTGNPVRISDTDDANADADQVRDPAIGYDSKRDQFRFVWASEHTANSDFEVRSRRVSSGLVNPDAISEIAVSNMSAGGVDDPSLAYLPTADRWVIAWEGTTAASETEIFVEIMNADGGGQVTPQAAISNAAGAADASLASVATNPQQNQALVAFVKNDVAGEGPEVFVQRVNAAGGQVPNATDQRISTMGPTGNVAFGVSTSRNVTTSYHATLDHYLVTWAGSDDLPGLVTGEVERYGQAINGATGAETGQDDFRLSAVGPDGNNDVAPEHATTVAVSTKRAWFTVWDADDNRPPLADGEYEIYGRFAGDDGDLDGHVVPEDCDDGNAGIHPGAVDILDNQVDEDCTGTFAENLDRDGDGSQRPGDCDDANAAVRPGAADIADNGVDEDCNGADAINLDRDGDGAARPGDCNDANPAIRPGAKDKPRNGIDEDCTGGDASFPNLTSGILPTWSVKGSRLTLVNLQITQQFPKGLKAKITCKGRKCPFKSKALKLGKVRRNAAPAISSLSRKQRRFRAGQTIDIWVSAPEFNSKISRLVLKARKIPVSQTLCALPGASKVQKRCT